MNITANKEYYPPMHTAEHILNQTMVRMFGCRRSFSNHIERKKSKCDYHFDRALSENELNEIASSVNGIIENDVPVYEEFMQKELAQEKFNLEKLPDDAGETIRIINIGDYDQCPCSGNHVSSTGEIGKFRIVSSDINEGILRIRFKLSGTTYKE